MRGPKKPLVLKDEKKSLPSIVTLVANALSEPVSNGQGAADILEQKIDEKKTPDFIGPSVTSDALLLPEAHETDVVLSMDTTMPLYSLRECSRRPIDTKYQDLYLSREAKLFAPNVVPVEEMEWEKLILKNGWCAFTLLIS